MNANEFGAIRERRFHLHLVDYFGDAFHDLIAGQDLAAFGHEFGDRLAVACSLQDEICNERDTLGIVELHASGEIVLNKDRVAISVEVANTGDRPIQVGSHYHFAETNAALAFDRQAAFGYRLDIPAGTAVRFEPGQSRDVSLIPYGGARLIYGFNQAVMGALPQVAAA